MFAGETRADAPAATAAEIVAKARRAFDAGRPEEAIEGFSRAYEMSGEPGLLFDIAEAHRKLGQEADAVRMYKNYLRHQPHGAHHDRADKAIRELEQKNATVPPPASSAVPVSPLTGAVAKPGQGADPLNAPPALGAPAPAPLLGSLTAPSATEGLGAEVANPTPSGSAGPVPAWVPWTLAGTTIALGVGAIVYGVSASNRYNDLHGTCGQTLMGCTPDEIQSVKSRALKANILIGLASLAAVGTGIVVYIDTRNAGVSALWRF